MHADLAGCLSCESKESLQNWVYAVVHMGLLLYLIILAVSGLFVGALARLALPGRDPMTIFQTILLGLAGTLIAGTIVWVAWHRAAPGIVLSVLCSSLILYFIRRSHGGGLTRPGRRRWPS
jgi:uncharacterized membrane protein YeaQ/YmgE (transglycosylase-associated protein family)